MDETANRPWEKLPAISAGCSESSGCDRETAAFLAERLFNSFRAGEANDPVTFVAMMINIFVEYPEHVVRRVSYGLPLESKWLPSLAEVKQACEKAAGGDAAAVRREREREHTRLVLAPSADRDRSPEALARVRARIEGLYPAAASAKPTEASLDELSARYRETPVTVGPALKAQLERSDA